MPAMGQFLMILMCALFLSLPTVVSADTLEASDRSKAAVETELRSRYGLNALCADNNETCLRGYSKFLRWAESAEKIVWPSKQKQDSKKVVVTLSEHSKWKSRIAILNPHDDAAKLESVFSAVFKGADFKLADDEGPGESRPLERTEASAMGSFCATSPVHYQSFLKDDVFDVTVVRGYFDSHSDNVLGYLSEQVFGFKRLPVDLEQDRNDVERLSQLLIQDGFNWTRVDDTEWLFTRDFFFQGEKKTAKIHLVTSTVRCPGEHIDGDGYVHRFDHEIPCARQARATQKAKDTWLGAFGKSQLIFYEGHSRQGKGPDFGPFGVPDGRAPLRSGQIEVEKLIGRETILAMSSCDSLSYFGEPIGQIKRQLGRRGSLHFVGTTAETSWTDGPDVAYRLIKMVMEAKCPRDIATVINLSKPQPSLEGKVFFDFDAPRKPPVRRPPPMRTHP